MDLTDAFRGSAALAAGALTRGVEYDGHHHRTPEQARRDLEREALLASAGWKIIRFGAFTVLHRPSQIVERTRTELVRRGW